MKRSMNRLRVTKEAADELNYKKRQPFVRILLTNSWKGKLLVLAWDGSKEEDDLLDNFHGLDFIMNKDLYERIKPIVVDYDGKRFIVDSSFKQNKSKCSSCKKNKQKGGCNEWSKGNAKSNRWNQKIFSR